MGLGIRQSRPKDRTKSFAFETNAVLISHFSLASSRSPCWDGDFFRGGVGICERRAFCLSPVTPRLAAGVFHASPFLSAPFCAPSAIIGPQAYPHPLAQVAAGNSRSPHTAHRRITRLDGWRLRAGRNSDRL